MITALDIVQRILITYGPILSLIKVAIVVYALYLTADAIFDVVAANTSHKKIFWGGQQEPTTTGAMFKILIAGFLATLGLNDYLTTMLGQSLFGEYARGLVVVESYLPQSQGNELGAYILVLVIGFAQIIGICAIARGFYEYVQRINKEGKATYRRGGLLILCGALLYNVETVYLVIVNTFGTVLGGGLFSIF